MWLMSRRCSWRGSVGGHAEDLVVAALLVGHPEHADRPAADQAAGERRLQQEHEGVERVAVLAERVLDEAVVGRVLRRGEQGPVEAEPPGVVVHLVLVALPLGDLHEYVELHDHAFRCRTSGWCQHSVPHNGAVATSRPASRKGRQCPSVRGRAPPGRGWRRTLGFVPDLLVVATVALAFLAWHFDLGTRWGLGSHPTRPPSRRWCCHPRGWRCRCSTRPPRSRSRSSRRRPPRARWHGPCASCSPTAGSGRTSTSWSPTSRPGNRCTARGPAPSRLRRR